MKKSFSFAREAKKIQKVRKSAFNCMHKFLKNSVKFMNQKREKERKREEVKEKRLSSVAGKNCFQLKFTIDKSKENRGKLKTEKETSKK